jgi:hypothetical protein
MLSQACGIAQKSGIRLDGECRKTADTDLAPTVLIVVVQLLCIILLSHMRLAPATPLV